MPLALESGLVGDAVDKADMSIIRGLDNVSEQCAVCHGTVKTVPFRVWGINQSSMSASVRQFTPNTHHDWMERWLKAGAWAGGWVSKWVGAVGWTELLRLRVRLLCVGVVCDCYLSP
jgi:hypothetical protein